MPKIQPTLIKVGAKGAYVNINSCVSVGIVLDQTHNKLRDDWKPTDEQKEPQGKDYVVYKADTLSFYFIGRDELMLRVGMEITKEEFEAAKEVIESIVFTMLPKNARISTTNEAT